MWLILDAFWMATCWAAACSPLRWNSSFTFCPSLWWTGTRRSKGTRRMACRARTPHSSDPHPGAL